MKVTEDNSLREEYKFSTINVGQVFWTSKLGLCIKVKVEGSYDTLAVNLADGKTREIFNDTIVSVVKAEVKYCL